MNKNRNGFILHFFGVCLIKSCIHRMKMYLTCYGANVWQIFQAMSAKRYLLTNALLIFHYTGKNAQPVQG